MSGVQYCTVEYTVYTYRFRNGQIDKTVGGWRIYMYGGYDQHPKPQQDHPLLDFLVVLLFITSAITI